MFDKVCQHCLTYLAQTWHDIESRGEGILGTFEQNKYIFWEFYENIASLRYRRTYDVLSERNLSGTYYKKKT